MNWTVIPGAAAGVTVYPEITAVGVDEDAFELSKLTAETLKKIELVTI